MSPRAALGKLERLVYSATKASLIGLTRMLVMELGGDGITVNAVAPGPIATDVLCQSNAGGAPRNRKIIDSIVVKRLGTAEDVARATMICLALETPLGQTPMPRGCSRVAIPLKYLAS